MTYTPRRQVVDYLASVLNKRDQWVFLVPLRLAEPVLGALVQFPQTMLMVDQGVGDVCIAGGQHMLLPLSVIVDPTVDTRHYGLVSLAPMEQLSRRDILHTLVLPETALKKNQFVLGLQSLKHGAPAVFPPLFTEALAMADPEAAAHIRQQHRQEEP